MTPNDLEILIHYNATNSPHPRIEAPAVQESIATFIGCTILASTQGASPGVYRLTQKGTTLIQMLCDTPMPVQKWVAPE